MTDDAGDSSIQLFSDPLTLERVYSESYPTVRHYVLSNSGSDQEAKDVFQEALITAWKNEREGRFKAADESSAGAYLFTIAKRKWVDKLRSSKRKNTMRLVHDEVKDSMPDLSDVEEVDVEYLNGLYERLDEKCQRLLKKFYFEKFSLREIASDLEVTEESARTLKYRCVMKLRKMHLALKNTESK